MKKISALALALVMTVSGNVFAAAADTSASVGGAGGAAVGGAAKSGVASGDATGLSAGEIGLGVVTAVLFIAAASQSSSSVAH